MSKNKVLLSILTLLTTLLTITYLIFIIQRLKIGFLNIGWIILILFIGGMLIFKHIFPRQFAKVDASIAEVLDKGFRYFYLIITGKMKQYEEWLPNAVKFFREVGFFEQYKSLNDKQLTEKLEELEIREYGRKLDHTTKSADFYLLKWDEKRVWLHDTEADVGKGNNVYVRTLKEWGGISRGLFHPKGIKETWDSKEGPIHITFTLNGKTHKIQPEVLDDYIDPGILSQINKILRGDYLFELCNSEELGQAAFITMLSQEEKQKLESKRGWKFTDLIR